MSDGKPSRAQAEETVLAMLAEDDFGRGDVLSSLASLGSVYPWAQGGGSGGGSWLPAAADASELLSRQRAAARSLLSWKARERTRTLAVGLIVCLNIGTEPPDAVAMRSVGEVAAATAPRGDSPAHARGCCRREPPSMRMPRTPAAGAAAASGTAAGRGDTTSL